MKISINSTVLKAALESTAKAISPKASFPILANFLLKGDGSTLRIIGSDASTTIIEEVPSDAEGSVCLPLSLLELVRTLPDDHIIIDTEEASANIAWKNGHSTIPAFDAKDYPVIKDAEGSPFIIPSDKFISALNHTIPCVADDEMRPAMNGVYFKVKEKDIDIVATDSHALALVTIPTETNSEQFDFIAQPDALNAVRNSARGIENIEIFHDENYCRFKVGSTTIITRKIVGKYPRYDSIIPTNFIASVKAGKKDIASSLKRVLVCSSKASGHIKLALNILDSTFEAQDLGMGVMATEKPDGVTFDGSDLTIGFKGEYLLRAINALESEDVEIKFTGAKSAAVVSSEADPCTILLMPVAI